MNVSSAPASGKGPKYFEPSCTRKRVLKIRGNFSFVMRITGYDFPSFKFMLYRGVYFLMRLFSSRNASYSLFVVMYSIERAWLIRRRVLMSLLPLKYEESLFLRLFALPT